MKYTLLFLLFIALACSDVQAQNSATVNWMTIEEAEALRKEEPRKILIDVYTDWCGWCKKMDASTFHNKKIVAYVNQHYYAVKMDGEYKKTISLGGREFNYVKEGRRGYHELPAELMQGHMSYPTLIFLDENMSMIQPLPGYQSAKDLAPILAFWAENHYKTTSWEEFSAGYGK